MTAPSRDIHVRYKNCALLFSCFLDLRSLQNKRIKELTCESVPYEQATFAHVGTGDLEVPVKYVYVCMYVNVYISVPMYMYYVCLYVY